MFIFKTHTVEQVQASAKKLSSTNIGSLTETPSRFAPEAVYEDAEHAVPNSIQNNDSKMENYASSTFMICMPKHTILYAIMLKISFGTVGVGVL